MMSDVPNVPAKQESHGASHPENILPASTNSVVKLPVWVGDAFMRLGRGFSNTNS